jgi:hypothetical protein
MDEEKEYPQGEIIPWEEPQMYYHLVEGQPVPCDPMTWMREFDHDHESRVVGKMQIGDMKVSTVFLGVAIDFSPTGAPLVFETRIFGGKGNGEQWRYATWAEAAAHHEAVCAELLKGDTDGSSYAT